MPSPKCNPRTLWHLDQAIECAKAKHSEADILAAAKFLELESYLPDVYCLALFPTAKDGGGSHGR